jgi:uncharacterized protein (DUF1499 family)
MNERTLPALMLALLLTGCTGMPEYTTAPEDVTELAACPASPNCVSSAADPDDSHYIAPIAIEGEPGAAWRALKRILAEDGSFEITATADRYIRAVATTAILRFKDDVEFLLDRDAGRIEMRSASRVGYSDLGKNRKRMEDIRSRMIEAGLATDA